MISTIALDCLLYLFIGRKVKNNMEAEVFEPLPSWTLWLVEAIENRLPITLVVVYESWKLYVYH